MQPSKPKFFSMNSYTPSNSSITPIGYSSTSTNDQPKSKTKLLIIVLIAAVILISIFAIIGASRRSENLDADLLLNRYINWILYEKDSDDNSFASETYDKYEFNKVEYNLSNANTVFFDKSIEIVDSYLENAREVGLDNLAYSYMEESKSLLVFFKQLAESGLIQQEDVFREYKSNGGESAKEYVNHYASNFIKHEDSSYSINYGKDITEYMLAYVSLLSSIGTIDCPEGDEECIVQYDTKDDSDESLNDQLSNGEYFEDRIKLLESYCWQIYEANQEYKEGENEEQ